MITIRFFASLRERLGTDGIDWEFRGPSTVGDLIQSLAIRYPVILDYTASLLVAVNQDYATLQTPVKPGDEVALFPPVSGG